MSDGTVTISTDLDSSGFESGMKSLSSLSVAAGNLISQAITKLVDGLVSFGTSAIQAGMDFDSAMSQLAATMGTTTDQISDLEEKAKELGKSTSFSATEAAEGLNILAQAGYEAEEQLDMIDSVLDLAAAGATSMDNAATYLTTTLKGYCVASEDVGDMTTYYSNLISKGATLVNTSVDELGTAMADSAANANAYSQSVETTTTALLALADGGYTGSEAATGLNRVMQSLYAPTDSAATALKSLGVSCYDEAGNARDLLDVIEDLENATADLTEEETNSYLQTILGTYGLKAYNAITTKSAEDIDALTASLIDCEDAAHNMAETQLDNLEGDITKCKSALEGLEIAISDEVTPTLRELVQFGTDQLGVLTDAIGENGLQGGIEAIGTVLANLLTYIGELAPSIIETASNLIHNFCEGLKDTATTQSSAVNIVGDLISAFLSCASDIWSTAIVLIASFVEGIADSVPDILQSASDMITTLVDAIIDYAPGLITAATNIIAELVTGLGNGLPSLVTQGATLLTTIAQAILDNLPTLVSAATEGMVSFVSGITDALPTLSTAAVDIMTSLGTYLQENLPTILETGLTALMELTASLRENAGVLVDGALAMIMSLADGLIDSLPTLIETVPTIVSNIANIINDNAPKLLESAFTLIQKLAVGLVEAIPTLVANLPQIIQAIVDVFTAFNWMTLGTNIITFIKDGIKSLASELPTALKNIATQAFEWVDSIDWFKLGTEVINLIKNGVTSLVSAIPDLMLSIGENVVSLFTGIDWANVGINVVQGIIDGLSSMVSNLFSAASDLGSNILSGVKDFLGIASPSKVMEDQGEYIVAGLVNGIADMPAEFNATLDSTDAIVTAWGQSLAANLQSCVSAAAKNTTVSMSQLNTSVSTALSSVLSTVNSWGNSLSSTIKSAVNAAAQNVGTGFTSLASSITKSLASALATVTSWGANLKSAGSSAAQSMVTAFNSQFTQLGTGLSSQLNQALTAATTWGTQLNTQLKVVATTVVTSFNTQLTPIVKNTTTLLNTVLTNVSAFATALQSKMLSAGKTSVTQLLSGMSNIDSKVSSKLSNVTSKVNSWGTSLTSTFTSIGKNVMQGLINGMDSMTSKLYASIKKSLSGLVTKAKKELGVASPSKVMKNEVGVYIPEGVAEGIEEETPVAEAAMEDMTDSLVAAAGDVDTSGVTLDVDAKTDALQEKLDNLTAKVSLSLPDISDFLSRLEAVVALRTDETSSMITARSSNSTNLESIAASMAHNQNNTESGGDSSGAVPNIEISFIVDKKKIARWLGPAISREIAWEGK